MAKRFLDTAIFDDTWFSELSVKGKLFFIYLITNCDHAGIIDLNIRLAEFKTGLNSLATVTKEVARCLISVRDNYYFIPSFIKIQYSKGLSPDCKAHKSVIDRLTSFGLFDIENGTVKKQLSNSLITVQDKDKDLVKVLDKVLDKDKDKLELRVIENFIFNSWNEIAERRPHLAKKRKINTATLKKLRSRIKEHPDQYEWQELFDAISKSRVLGRMDDCAWFTFDWILRSPDNFDKILAGWIEFKAKDNTGDGTELSADDDERIAAEIAAKYEKIDREEAKNGQ